MEKETNMRKIAEKFCSVMRPPHEQTPWNKDGKTLATSNYFAVMIDGEFGESMDPTKKYPNISVAFPTDLPNELPIPSELPKVKMTQCKTCDGSGKIIECLSCDGGGSHACDCGHYHNCGECEGNGFKPFIKDEGEEESEKCEDCEGSGKLVNDHVVDLGPFAMKASFILLAASLPGAKVFRFSESFQPIIVEFEGGKAAFMGVNK